MSIKDQTMTIQELLDYVDDYKDSLAHHEGSSDEYNRGYFDGLSAIRDDIEGWIIKKKVK
jgi:molecular chaperone GrpE (heat shock protein)